MNSVLINFRISVICLILFVVSFSFSDTTKDKKNEKIPSLAVLDLVDLSSGRSLPNFSSGLRLELTKLTRWKIMLNERAIEIFKQYQKDPYEACNNKQCGFDKGSLLQVDYLIFGTASRFKNSGMITIKLLNIKSATIVWSKVITSRSDKNSMMTAFISLREDLSSAVLNEKKEDNRLLAIMKFSNKSLEADILFERILTHTYGLGGFEIMSPVEVEELMSVLEIEPASLMNSINSMGKIGEQLGVNAIIFSQFTITGINYKHSILLYDVDEKTVTLSMPTMPTGNFKQMLSLENNFFSGLEQIKKNKK